MKGTVKKIVGMGLFLFGVNTFAGDLTCYGYTSTTNHFDCNVAPANSGNCTWWAAYKRSDLAAAGITGNAGLWYDNAKNLGFNVGSDPRVGAVVVFSNPGHVAYIESKSDDGSFSVSEMDAYGSVGFDKGVNYATYHLNGDGTYHRNSGTTSWTLRGFIYDRLFVPKVGQTICARGKGVYGICWQIATLANISCQGGKNWEAFPNDWELESAYVVSDNRYCPDNGGIGGSGSSSSSGGGSTTPPVTGSNNSGRLSDLVMRDVYLEDANYNRVTTLHIGEKGHCHMSVINNGAVKAKGTFENRCWLSVGNQFDGSDAENIGKEDMSDLDNGQSRISHEDFYAPAYPGKRNLVGCTDASSKIVESNEKNNCNLGSKAVPQEYRFEVWSSPNLTTTAIGLSNGKTVLNVNEPFVLSSATYNAGENFGQDYVYIGYFDNGVLIGQNQILRENMQGGYSKIEDIAVPLGIAMTGIHELKACPDFINSIAETDETDNCMSVRVEVRDPNDLFPCPVITQATWGPPWNTTMPAPYNNPPFKTAGTLVVTPWCAANLPNHLEIVVQGASNLLIAPGMRIKNSATGGSYATHYFTICSVPKQPGSGWCSGEARLIVEGKDVDTSVANKPTQILVYACDLIGGLVTNCRWMLQAATISARQ
ncbi:MAG: CHAP domain-containing protein [Candidatus Moraniibacteriota bacterium]|nr:MAG: CHAP domain-containing protein [Candidatus Moranbacteria bacterium]